MTKERKITFCLLLIERQGACGITKKEGYTCEDCQELFEHGACLATVTALHMAKEYIALHAPEKALEVLL